MPLDAPAAPRSSRRWTWPKRALVAVASLVGAFLLWILLLNVALWTGFVAWAVSGDYRMSSLDIEYGFAWVVWPTRVHVEDFELRIDAYRYQLELEIPDGEIDIALVELLGRRFHARSIEGQDARATFRLKAPKGKVSEARRAMFGDIEGATPPVRLYGPPNLPPYEKAWEVQLDDIDGNFVSLWVNELNFTPMDARLRGALRSRSGYLFAIDDARFEVRSAELHVGDELLAKDWTATLQAAVMDYNPFEIEKRSTLHQLSMQLDAAAEVVSMAGLDPFLAGKGVKLRKGEGTLELGVHIDRGVLMPETEVLYWTNALVASKGRWRGSTALRFALGVGDDEKARAAMELQGLEVGDGSSKKGAITAEHVDGFIVATQTDLTANELPIVDAELKVPKLVVRDASALQGISKSFEPREGGLQLSLHVQMPKPGRLEHEISGKLDGLLVAQESTRVRASGAFSLQARSDAKMRSGKAEKLQIDVRDVDIRSKHGSSENTWVNIIDGTLEWKSEGKQLEARVKGRLDDLRPILAHVDDRKQLVERVPDLDVTRPFDFDIAIDREGKVTDIRVLRFDRPGLHIEGFRHAEGKQSRSVFRLERAEIGIVRDEKKKRDIEVGADEGWLRKKMEWAKRL